MHCSRSARPLLFQDKQYSPARPLLFQDKQYSPTRPLPFQDKQEREEEERKKRLQLYVFVLRCISYPFNAKQPNDLTKRYQKVTKAFIRILHHVGISYAVLGPEESCTGDPAKRAGRRRAEEPEAGVRSCPDA